MKGNFFTQEKEKKKVKGEALLDLLLTSRKEVIEFTILRKKKSRIKIIHFKKVFFNKLRSLRNKFIEKSVKEGQLIPKETI